jgi:hypothetical protein
MDEVVGLLRGALAAALLIAPGLLVTGRIIGCILPADLRLVTAVTVTPAVLGLEVVAASVVGLSFGAFLAWIAPLNLAGFLLLRGTSPDGRGLARLVPPVCTALLVIAPIIGLMSMQPLLRDYGWHNMMQIASLQQFAALPSLPEELDLAGFRLNYPWLGLVQLAVLGTLLERPPTQLFPAVNLLHFACMLTLIVAASRLLRDAGAWAASLATAAVILTPGVLAVVATLVSLPGLGETRVQPMTAKFAFLDTMVLGLSAFALLVFAVIEGLTGAWRRAVPLAIVAALACGMVYPLLFPACAAMLGVFLAGALVAQRGSDAERSPPLAGTASSLVLGTGAATLLVALYLLVIGADAGPQPVRFAQAWEIRHHLIVVVLAFAPLLLPAFRLSWRRGTPMVLLFGPAMLVLGFVLISLPKAVEYKLLFAALLGAAPVLAAGFAPVARGWLVLATAALWLAQSWAFTQWHDDPRALTHAVALASSERSLRPDDGWSGGWMEAVRERTPPDTVLLTAATHQPLPVFVGRALYVAMDAVDPRSVPPREIGRAGYGMTRDDILLEVKRYPPDAVRQRLGVLRSVLAPHASPPEMRAAVSALAALGRPVALHGAVDAALATTLRRLGIGRLIHERADGAVWLIRHDELAALDAGLSAEAAEEAGRRSPGAGVRSGAPDGSALNPRRV